MYEVYFIRLDNKGYCSVYSPRPTVQVVDKHFSILVKQHIETRFIKIQAEKSPFLDEKLKIVALPTIALIKTAKVDDYAAGFDELGGTDDFSTEEPGERLAKA